MYEYEYARVRVLLHGRLVLFWCGSEAVTTGGTADEQLLCVSISSMMARASM